MARPTFIHGFREGSTTGTITQFAASVVLFKTGVKPLITTVPGQQGYAAFQHFQSESTGKNAFLVADTMTLALNAVRRGAVGELQAIEPMIKLTRGISLALVSSAASGIGHFRDLQAIGAGRLLTVAHGGPSSASEVVLRWISPSLSKVRELTYSGDESAIKAVAQGEVDLAIVVTNALPAAMREKANLAVLATFGAQRSPHFPDTPTFRELSGDDRKSFTISFSMFAKPDSIRADVEKITRAFVEPFPPTVLKSLDWLAQDVIVNDETIVRETVRRDLRVALSVASQLETN